MSWIVGLIGSPIRTDLRDKLIGAHEDGCMIADTNHYAVLCDARSNTCMYSRPEPGSGCFAAVVGSPVLLTDGLYSVLDEKTFADLITLDASEVHKLVLGQYSIVRSNGIRFQAFSDPNSLRSLYVADYKAHLVFSSHLHLIARIVENLTVDFEAFGSHWLAHNQFSDKSLVKGVSRMCGSDLLSVSVNPRGPLSENDQPVFVEKSRIEPTYCDNHPSPDPFREIQGFLRNHGGNLKLALSGGLDSRLLFGLALHERGNEFETFVYGDPNDPDVFISRQLSHMYDVSCNIVTRLSISDALDSGLLERYATETFCISPLSGCEHTANYTEVFGGDSTAIIIDGAFGEIGRCQFYRKIELLRHLSGLAGINTATSMKALSFQRADIFKDAVLNTMNAGFSDDTEGFMSFLFNQNGTRNEDLAAVKYRRRNFFGYGQAWIDQFGMNMMPFGQNPFVRAIFTVPTRKRRGNSYYKRTTKHLSPALSTIPLAKGSQTYPFSMPHTLLPLVLSAGKIFRWTRAESSSYCSPFLILRDFVNDLVRSRSTRTYGPYDIYKIDSLVDGFYSGRSELHKQLDWFLSFELWRRGNKL